MVRRVDESLCRLRLAAAIVEIQRLKAGYFSAGCRLVTPAAEVPEREPAATFHPHSTPPTRRKSYAVDPLGVWNPAPGSSVGPSHPVSPRNRPPITNLGGSIDVLM